MRIGRKINRILLYVFGEGSWHFTHTEMTILTALEGYLDAPHPEVLAAQISAKQFIDRSNRRISVIFQDDPEHFPHFPTGERHDKLYKIRVSVGGKTETHMITIENGCLATIQLKQDRRVYQNAPITVLDVAAGRSSDSYIPSEDAGEPHDWT